MAPRPSLSLIHRQTYSDLDRALLEALCQGPSERISPLLERFRKRAALTQVGGTRGQPVKNDLLSPPVTSKG